MSGAEEGALPFADDPALDALAAEAAAAQQPPAAGQAQQQTAADNREAAMLAVAVGLSLISKGVEKVKGVKVVFGQETLAEGADAVAPLLAKHNGKMPPWVMQYREELGAAVFAGKIAFQVWLAIKEAESGAAAPAAA
ncbi:hypothetical protein C3942_21780 [Solimonas fluminis]|uniref:Uncharacterized protein n=1 Tax=Solimonas fluminis TaxID=2086571 RepID=A0A2S5TAB2_9GAMM|nr:hypothetical protein [Solimonas fluminis]PPE71787.1 hypothetical protein C3942_21780 [Solimonas fluminis]